MAAPISLGQPIDPSTLSRDDDAFDGMDGDDFDARFNDNNNATNFNNNTTTADSQQPTAVNRVESSNAIAESDRSSSNRTIVDIPERAGEPSTSSSPRKESKNVLDADREQEDYDSRSLYSSDSASGSGQQTPDSSENENDKDAWSNAKVLKHDQKLLESRGIAPTRSLDLAYNHLSVRGTGGADDVTYGPTIGGIIAPWTNRKYKKKAIALASARVEGEEKGGGPSGDAARGEGMSWQEGDNEPKKGEEGLRKGERFLLKDFSGLVKAGEMMLVVGRPGSGCTTFLKALAGLHNGYAGIDGKVYYGSMDSDAKLKPFRSDVIFNSEEDLHDANLHVGHTLDFALRMNTPSAAARHPKEEGGEPMTEKEYQAKTKAHWLKAFGLEHTNDTKVGDQYTRGVSGGEKKRVSIAEVLTSRASIQCWDNATRGLDANTALGYAKVMRDLSDIERNATVVSLYQAGNGIYNLFDKVTVIAEGRLLYYGPRSEARKYFEDLGFEHLDGANTADYLTAVTATNERKIKEGHEGKVPTAPVEFAEIYAKSDMAKRMREELDAHLKDTASLDRKTKEAQDVIQQQKSKGAIKGRPEKVDYFTQVKAALIRDYQQRWGDQWTLWARQGTTVVQALIVGSIFYSAPKSTGGIFLRGGTLFLSLLFPSLISLAETTAAFSGRAVSAKHKAFSMYRPSAVALAQTIGDLPIFFVQIVVFTLIIYFMVGLQVSAGHYFAYLLFVYITTITTTAFFRFVGYSFGTFNDASKVSGLLFSIIVTYAGYIIYVPSMHPWFSWIRWINPVYYSFEALMSHELTGLTLECVQPQLAPYGPGYTGAGQQGCALPGANPGTTTVDGTRYLDQALNFTQGHMWRNFGAVVALLVGFITLLLLSIERLPAAGSNKAILLYKRGGGGKFIRATAKNGNGPKDEEEGTGEKQNTNKNGEVSDDSIKDVHSVETVFTWKDLTYVVEGDKQLLNKVSGYCKAGQLTALMGSSGAGKTTLMDVLAQRKSEGTIHGEVLMNGKKLPMSFQRTTGYCEQVDVHLPQATVREALEFSAVLRQPRSIPYKEKIAYVDVIIDLLELHDIEDALVGTPGQGLGVEQRKRLTIGVELVSKPTLLFLDEPTSGLDGQSSYLIVSFLRKLAAAGQAVLCTIHQPSASLFSRFDNLLLLKAGGNTVYFGAIDHLSDYFSSNKVKIPKEVNPAEFMIDVVSGDLSKGRDWAKVWTESEECKTMMKEIEELKKTSIDKNHETEDMKHEYASTTITQLKLVTKRASTQLWRDTEYVTNKVALHVGAALFNGFSFWMIGNAYADLQNRLFTIFQFVFVAPGVIAQTQPKFIANRDIFETREKKAKLYCWQAFVFGEIIAEVPYLLVCAFLYFVCWYPVVGFSFAPGVAGPVYLQMTLYEFLYTGIGQFVAAYAPNAVFAALVNPLLIGVLVMFSGVLVPYQQITSFWRYWLYYLDPFNYLIGGLLVFPLWDVQVTCKEEEFGIFNPPSGQTCGAYMQTFLSQPNTGYINNPDAMSDCQYCIYKQGSQYLASVNLPKHVYGYRDICITLLFCLSSYGFVFLLLKLRSKRSKTAE
ncbi:hypothetical protein CI109_104404 [Kwoniella shandongensis]|uniref:Uncharacterized protein n=1 Tax=Kwoniella shandongensis TaxID=1734106 RepID=A0A5M6BX14_9TREE|nr:uncharacterized protein CI109_004197 [Kwoniella shandongensis]KAA5527384.1 hypothetical protein CI109_004197 [Kwoniella shandongensis]